MPYITSATIGGLSRADGTTARTITMARIANVTNGFTLRETGVSPKLAQTVTYRSFEEKARGGKVVRVIAETWSWPYEDPAVPGEVAGYINHGATGLRYPVDAPANVLKDVRTQLSNRASGVGGSVGFAHITDPMLNGLPAF